MYAAVLFDVRRGQPQPTLFQQRVVIRVVPLTVCVTSDMLSGDFPDSPLMEGLQRGKVHLRD